MPNWAIISSAIVAVILIATIIWLFLLVRKANKPEAVTREEFALQCIPAYVAFIGLGISAISSKDSIPDQVVKLIAAIFGLPPSASTPIALSEQLLVGVVIFVGVSYLNKLHANWNGAISADEEEAKRLQQNTSLLPQAVSELRRVWKRQPARSLYFSNQKIDPLTLPIEPNLVWHDHARELFELWQTKVAFSDKAGDGWDNHDKCWVGRNRQTNVPLFLFCSHNEPTSTELDQFKAFANRITPATNKLLYVVFQSETAINREESGFRLVSEEYLYQHIVDFDNYFYHVCKQVEQERLPSSELTIRDIFTSSSIAADSKGEQIVSANLGAYLAEWAKAPPGKQLALLGEYGQGKTTGTQMFVYDAVKSDMATCNGRIPILLELRGKSPVNLQPAELLAAWGEKYGLQAKGLMKLLIAGRLIIIFEGFDEMANIATLAARVGHFRSLWQFAFAKNKVMFTGRRNMFFDDEELNTMFRKDALDKLASMCQVLHLCPFDLAKIKEGLRWASTSTRDEIIEATRTNSQILDIAARPSLLFLIGNLWADLRKEHAIEKLTSAYVIDCFIRESLARQAAKESSIGFTELTPIERQYFHEGIAFFMAQAGSTNQISNVDLTIAIEKLYKSYPADVHIAEDTASAQKQAPLKIRYKGNVKTIEQIATDIRTHGILVNDLSRTETFKFAHKSFYECIVGKINALSTLIPKSIFYSSILGAAGRVVRYRDETPEIMRFFAEVFVAQVQRRDVHGEVVNMVFETIIFGAKKGIVKPFIGKSIGSKFNHVGQSFFTRYKLIDYRAGALEELARINESILFTTLLFSLLALFQPKSFISLNLPLLRSLNPLSSLIYVIIGIGGSLIFSWAIVSICYFRCVAILLLSANKAQAQEYIVTLTRSIGAKNTNFLVEEVKKKYGADLIRYP